MNKTNTKQSRSEKMREYWRQRKEAQRNGNAQAVYGVSDPKVVSIEGFEIKYRDTDANRAILSHIVQAILAWPIKP